MPFLAVWPYTSWAKLAFLNEEWKEDYYFMIADLCGGGAIGGRGGYLNVTKLEIATVFHKLQTRYLWQSLSGFYVPDSE
jgi:hypothetical protein